MRIDEIVWLPEVVDKLEYKHGVKAREVEDVLYGDHRTFRAERGYTAGEDVYVAYGQSSAGRYLIVFFLRKPGNRALIMSAREQTYQERQRYGRK